MMLQDNHIHTNYSDGKNTPEEMIRQAINMGLKKITFTDHVRANSEWVWNYVDEIEKLKRLYDNIDISIGVECKVIDHEGNIDCPVDILLDNKIEKVAAIHRIPTGDGNYIKQDEIKGDLEKSFRSYFLTLKGIKKNQHVMRIAHPFSLFGELQHYEGIDWTQIGDSLIQSNKKIEFNAKYDNSMVPCWIWDKLNDRIVVGSDSHSIENLVDRKVVIETFINKFMGGISR